MKRKALGKGLRSLIPEAPAAARAIPPAGGPDRIDIDRIRPNRRQPRRQFDAETLADLAESLKKNGVLQPVLVRPRGDGTYELIAGERRWRAAQLAGLLKVPAIVREVADDRVLELALVENLQREDLNPIDAAEAYQTLIDDLGLTQEEAAARVGKRRATVANALRLLNLQPKVQERIRSGEVSAGHAKALASVTHGPSQIELAERIVRDGISVRAAEALAARIGRGALPSPRATKPRDPNVASAEDALQRALGTKVRIVQGRGASGRVELHYFSADELDRLYQLVLRAARGR